MIKDLLSAELFQFFVIFCRLGTMFIFVPGFSASYVNAKMRLSIALTVSLVITPFLIDKIPAAPDNLAELVKLIFLEITYGVFLGMVLQSIMLALDLAATYMGVAIGFSNAQAFDPTTQHSSNVIAVFLMLIGTVLIFVTDLHHLMIKAIIDSYELFEIGKLKEIGDFANYLAIIVNKSFIIGFQIVAPFIAFSIIFYSGMGLVSRLMPSFNIFFMSLPLQIYLGLGIMLLCIASMITWFLKYFEDNLYKFIG